MGLSADAAIQLTKEIISKNRAVDRAEVLRDSYHRRLIAENPGNLTDQQFSELNQRVIAEAKNDALNAPLPGQGGGGSGGGPGGGRRGG